MLSARAHVEGGPEAEFEEFVPEVSYSLNSLRGFIEWII